MAARAQLKFAWDNGALGLVAGLDEAGRGPWAGPVMAAAVILNPDAPILGLNDSKKLSSQRRADLAGQIQAQARYGLGLAEVDEIDRLNILGATFLAMRRALEALGMPKPDLALVDGNRDPGLGVATRLVVGGDGLHAEIAAASILAKVARDAVMVDLAGAYPDYGFERHKGYGTADHQAALTRFGPTPHHRRSFAPIHKILCQKESERIPTTI